jgi:plasmid stabilization system protein ParE
MTSFAVEIAPRARAELLRIASWWKEHSGRPGLVGDDLAEALDTLSLFPEIGAAYPYAKRPGVRRWLLSRTQIYVYYRVIEEKQVVRIVAFWHTARGRGPRI